MFHSQWANAFCRRFIFTVVLVFCSTAFAHKATAQYSWTQPLTGSTSNWSTGPWTPSTPISGTTTVLNFNVLAGSSAYTFTNDIGAFTVNGINLNNFSTGLLTIDLGANPLTFDGTTPFLTNNGPGNVTISGAGGVVLNATTAFTGAGNGTLTIASVISGNGGLTVNQTGNGVVALTGANTFIGPVTVTAGVLAVSTDASFGDASNNITLGGGALLATGAITSSRTITLSSAGIISGTSAITLNGNLTGSGALTKLDSGVLTLNSANAGFTGAVTIGSNRPVVVGSTLVTNPGTTTTVGMITLASAGQLNNSSSISINSGALLTITRGTSTLTAANRLGTVPITLSGGSILYSPGSAAAESTTTLGTMAMTGGLNVIRTAVVAGDLCRNLSPVWNVDALSITQRLVWVLSQAETVKWAERLELRP